MAPPAHVNLGPLTQRIVTGAHWLDQDEFPAHQSWADDVERVLSFLEEQHKFQDFFPRLNRQNFEHRAAALAEARTGLVLRQQGFDILEWEPVAIQNHPGDLSVRLDGAPAVFVEVKAPTWQGELARTLATADPQERARILERLKREKYINAEARSVDPAGDVLKVIANNATPKLADNRANLIVVEDDLFMSAVGNPFVHSRFQAAFKNGRAFERIGGVFLMDPQSQGGRMRYRYEFVQNAACLPSCALAPEVLSVLEFAAAQSATP